MRQEELIKLEYILNIFGHPLLGDTLYGNASPLISRQALHAYKVKFIHPITKENMEFISNLPEEMKKITPSSLEIG